MIKIIVGFLSIGFSLFIANLYCEKLKRIYETYGELTIFNEKLYTAIEYYKDDVHKVAKECDFKSDVKPLFESSDYLKNEVTNNKTFLKDLPKNDKKEIIDYLNKVGKSDYETQINYVKDKHRQFCAEKDKAFKKYKEMKPVSYKIALLAGITIFIIII